MNTRRSFIVGLTAAFSTFATWITGIEHANSEKEEDGPIDIVFDDDPSPSFLAEKLVEANNERFHIRLALNAKQYGWTSHVNVDGETILQINANESGKRYYDLPLSSFPPLALEVFDALTEIDEDAEDREVEESSSHRYCQACGQRMHTGLTCESVREHKRVAGEQFKKALRRHFGEV